MAARFKDALVRRLAGSDDGAAPGVAVELSVSRTTTYLVTADGAFHLAAGKVAPTFDDLRLPGDKLAELTLEAGVYQLAASSIGGTTRVWLLPLDEGASPVRRAAQDGVRAARAASAAIEAQGPLCGACGGS